MAHARRLAPLLLQTAQRATIGDLDMYTQHMSPDALDGHRGPCLLLHNTPALMSVVPYARLAVGAKERASCLARPCNEAAAVGRKTELVVVNTAKVGAPCRVLIRELSGTVRHKTMRERGGPHANRPEMLGKRALGILGGSALHGPATARDRTRLAVRTDRVRHEPDRKQAR